MSALIRFNIGSAKYKARMFEQGSRKLECKLCGNRRFGILIRHVEPAKHESGICHECLVRLVVGLPIINSLLPEVPVIEPKPVKKKIVKKKVRKPLFKKLKGQDNVNAKETATIESDGGASEDQSGQAVS